MRPSFSVVPFQDLAQASADLARLEDKLAPALTVPLASLLAASPDPDGALTLLERYTREAPPEVLRELARAPEGLTYLVAVFGYSGFLAETFLAEPGLTVQFARDRNFTKLKSKEDLMQDYARFSTTNPDPWLSSQLARFKRRNYLRLVLKDVLGLSTLGETTLELSVLADVILSNALLFCDQELEKRYGQPQYRDLHGRIARSEFSVVSLGSLGGNELNYASDINLLFVYSHDGETAGSSERDSVIANKEYFVQLAQAITRTITQATPHGQVFRADLRLRPEGEDGDLAISLRSALEYYEHRARNWELQMLLRVRHSAGDPKLTRDFLHGVEPYVYGSPVDLESVEGLLRMREKEMPEGRGSAIDVERHRGGIRDIELLTQCLQRVLGGRDRWVRSGGTLLALRKLHDQGRLSDSDYAALTAAYEFLRKVAHRAQLESEQQARGLPGETVALDRLARRVGIEGGREEPPGEILLRRVQDVFRRVGEIYQRVIHPHVGAASRAAFELHPVAAGPLNPGAHSYQSVLTYLDAQAPELARLARESSLPERARKNATQFFAALLGSSERFRLARDEPQRVRRALEVIGASEYLAGLLIHHPEEIALLDSTPLAASAPPAQIPALQREIGLETSDDPQAFAWVTEGGLDLREKIALLRRDYRARVLELGAADLIGGRSIFAALGRWSVLARQSISSALEIARQALRGKTASNASLSSSPFMVLGLGRLGFNEFDLASDAHLVFVIAPGTPPEEKAVWSRVAEKTIELLSSYTREGTLFAVDTRLRPNGQESGLVVREDALLRHVGEAADVGEALTYLNACAVAGNLPLARGTVSRLVARLLDRFALGSGFERELSWLRQRVEGGPSVSLTNTKPAPEGYADVGLAVSFLRLRHRLAIPPGRGLAEQIDALRAASLVSRGDARALTAGAAFLRSLDHAIRLVTGAAADGLPEHARHREAVECLMRRWGLVTANAALARSLREAQEQVNSICRRMLGSEVSPSSGTRSGP